MGPCTYCGFCERFGCGNYSKASPQTTVLPALMRRANFMLRTEIRGAAGHHRQHRQEGHRRHLCRRAGRGVGAAGRHRAALRLPVLHNVRLLLLSGIGKPYDPETGEGVVGRNYAYQTGAGASAVLRQTTKFNPFIGTGALQQVIDDFNGDNFDHGRMASSAAAASPAPTPTAARSSTARRARDRRAGAARGRRQRSRRLPDVRPASAARAVQLQLPRLLSRPRPDLHRPVRPQAAAHDVRLARQRTQDGDIRRRPLRRDRPTR